MTLVAVTINKGFPMMIGDIYFTQRLSSPSNGIVIPTYQEGTGGQIFSETPYQPHSMMIKLYIINSQLCVGFAGRWDQITSYLRALRLYFQDLPPTSSELECIHPAKSVISLYEAVDLRCC